MSYGRYDDDARRKRYIIIGVSSFLLVSMVVAVTIGVTLNKEGEEKSLKANPSVKAIKEFCAPTDYKRACEDSLKSNAKNTTDPMELVRIAFVVTKKSISEAARRSTTLKALQSHPRTKMALDQCTELMDYAVGELKHSFDELGALDFTKIDEMLVNLRIWLSAAISHEETCLDGFQQTTGNAAEKMKRALRTAMQLTHNGLAIATELSNFVSQLQMPGIHRRRLLASGKGHEFPAWVHSSTKRRLLSTMAATPVKADMVVAQDGSGQFRTINEALRNVPKRITKTFVIYIKEGVYAETVQINRSMTNLMFIGDGNDKTRITGNKGFTDGITTFRTATVAIVGDYFIAKNIGFENSAGPQKHQAVAVRVQSDKSIFYNCSFDGYEDTLYAHSHRQFYRDCTISGTIDFLFGDAAAVFQNCTIVVRQPLENQQCPITAHGRVDGRESTGFLLQGCTIVGDADYSQVKDRSKAYLGRPWKPFARTVYMNTYIPEFVSAGGWLPWNGDFGLNTAFFAELKNKGPGASQAARVTWPAIKKLTENQALQFVPQNFIHSDTWIPGKGVPYTAGMLGRKKVKTSSVSTPGSS